MGEHCCEPLVHECGRGAVRWGESARRAQESRPWKVQVPQHTVEGLAWAFAGAAGLSGRAYGLQPRGSPLGQGHSCSQLLAETARRARQWFSEELLYSLVSPLNADRERIVWE